MVPSDTTGDKLSIRMLARAVAARWRVILAAAVGGGLAIGAFVAWDTSRAVERAQQRADADSLFAFTERSLVRPLPTDVETIGVAPVFRDAAFFRGQLFVAGPQGLTQYDAAGAVTRRWRAGLELPPVGLVSMAVGVLVTASEPELLIGTDGEGLLIFNGQQLRHVRPDRADQRKLTAILPLGAGRVLLGTSTAGVLVYDGRRLTPAHSALANIPVTTLAGSDGDAWIGTLDRGVFHWRAGVLERIDESAGLPDRRVLSIAVTGDRAFVGTALGVAEVHDSRVVRTLAAGGFATALAVRAGTPDTLLVATLDATIARIPIAMRSSRGARPIAEEVPDAIHRFLVAEPVRSEAAGALYALTEDALYAVDEGAAGVRRLVGADSGRMTDRNVSALALGDGGRLWVGYFDRGLDILDAPGGRTAHVENDRVFCVNRIVHESRDGMTAVATANGLALFDAAGRQKQVLGRGDGLIANHVTDLWLDRGRFTVATPAGLTFIDAGGARSLYAFHGLVNNHVYALGVSGAQVVAGTLGGLSVLENGAVRASYTTANSALTHNWVTAIARVGDEWFVGTYGGGVFALDAEGNSRPFTDLAGPIEVNPNAMTVTATHVFAGTLSRGLLVYDRAARRWTTYAAGLPSLNVTALASGDQGLYVGTDNGIVRLGPPVFQRP